jgi:acyl carrier protein
LAIAQSIKEILVAEVLVEVPADQMDEDDSLRNTFGLDSLGFVELRVQCEDRFGITIPDSEFTPENFSSIRSLVGLIERLLTAPERGVAAGERA